MRLLYAVPFLVAFLLFIQFIFLGKSNYSWVFSSVTSEESGVKRYALVTFIKKEEFGLLVKHWIGQIHFWEPERPIFIFARGLSRDQVAEIQFYLHTTVFVVADDAYWGNRTEEETAAMEDEIATQILSTRHKYDLCF